MNAKVAHIHGHSLRDTINDLKNLDETISLEERALNATNVEDRKLIFTFMKNQSGSKPLSHDFIKKLLIFLSTTKKAEEKVSVLDFLLFVVEHDTDISSFHVPLLKQVLLNLSSQSIIEDFKVRQISMQILVKLIIYSDESLLKRTIDLVIVFLDDSDQLMLVECCKGIQAFCKKRIQFPIQKVIHKFVHLLYNSQYLPLRVEIAQTISEVSTYQPLEMVQDRFVSYHAMKAIDFGFIVLCMLGTDSDTNMRERVANLIGNYGHSSREYLIHAFTKTQVFLSNESEGESKTKLPLHVQLAISGIFPSLLEDSNSKVRASIVKSLYQLCYICESSSICRMSIEGLLECLNEEDPKVKKSIIDTLLKLLRVHQNQKQKQSCFVANLEQVTYISCEIPPGELCKIIPLCGFESVSCMNRMLQTLASRFNKASLNDQGLLLTCANEIGKMFVDMVTLQEFNKLCSIKQNFPLIYAACVSSLLHAHGGLLFETPHEISMELDKFHFKDPGHFPYYSNCHREQ